MAKRIDMNDRFEAVLIKLKERVSQLDTVDDWLLVTINTMKAIVENTCKEDVEIVLKATGFQDTVQVQQLYDMVQGKYGREGFSARHDSQYYYLSSLVARFPRMELSEEDRNKITEYFGCDKFFLYKL